LSVFHPRLTLHYDPARISDRQALGLLEAYRHLLRQVTGNDAIRLGDMRWPDGHGDSVCDQVERMVARYPDRIALSCNEQNLSYAELGVLSDRLAQDIRSRLREPESCVGVIAGTSLHTMIAVVAILKAGHVVVQIDPTLPRDRAEKLLADCRAQLVLGEELPCTPEGHESDLPAPHPAQLAYVTLAFEATNDARALMLSHRALAGQVEALRTNFALTEEDRWFLRSAPGSAAWVAESIAPFCTGATLVPGAPSLTIAQKEMPGLLGLAAVVVDGLGQVLPPHYSGELYLRGPALARGYLHDPRLTAERFIPCADGIGERTYETGAYVSRDEHGRLLYRSGDDEKPSHEPAVDETHSYVPPQTATQRSLCVIWGALLCRESVGITDNFLKLGGHSLLVTRLVAHVERTLGIEISPRLVFDYPVLRDFAGQIDRLRT
jgi:non-ribosomal peptide synthetase component F